MILQLSEVLQFAQDYEQFPEKRALIINTLLATLRDVVDDEIAAQKLILAPHERAGEASFAILQAIQSFSEPEGWVCPFEEHFLYYFRQALRKLKPRKDHICIEGLAVEDTQPNPEQAYIVKEQMELIRKFLTGHYDPLTVDQFMRRYADGEKFDTISSDYGVSVSTLAEKLNRVKLRVSKYMKRITEFHK